LGEDLSALLTLGDSFTDRGHYVVAWSFAGDDQYQPADGVAPVDITEAPALVVNTTEDVLDPYDGVVSLRDAIAYAEMSPGNPIVTFDPAVFAAPQTIHLNGTALSVQQGEVTIAGPGADRLTIDAGHQDSVFMIGESAT